MGNISDSAELKEAIHLLEAEKSAHFQEMQATVCLAFESLEPANFIKSGKLLGLLLQLGITNLVVYTPVAIRICL